MGRPPPPPYTAGATMSTVDTPFRLGDWSVRPRENRIERNGESRTLEPKVMEVLAFLASRPGEVRLREEILDAVWPETFVAEEVLNNAIWELRRALGDDARRPLYIRTVPRRGYGLVAPVEPMPTTAAGPARRLGLRSALGAGLLAALGLTGVLALRASLHRAGTTAWPTSIAVLPLEAVSDAPTHADFAAALTDSLTTQLAAAGRYEVPSRTSVAELLAQGTSAGRIPRELGTDAFLEGTLAFGDDGRARLSIQLIGSASDRHLWARVFEDDIRDRLGAERRLARRVTLELARGRRAVEGVASAGGAANEEAATPSEGASEGWRFRTGGEVWSSPRAAGDLVLVGSDDGNLYALDRASGAERWRLDAGGALRDDVSVSEGRVFLATAGYLRAVALDDGRELWRRRLPVISPPTLVRHGNGAVVAGSYDRNLYALDPDDGSVLWRVPTTGENRTAAAVAEGVLAAGSDAGELLLVDLATGTARARVDLGSPVAGVAAAGGDLFVATDGGFLYRLSVDGRERWRRHLGSRLGVAPLPHDGVVYQGTGDGRLVALDAADGEALWTFAARDAVGATPGRADGTLLVGSLDHALYAVDAVSGTELWRYATGGWVVTQPLVVEGRVVFSGLDGVVRSLPLDRPAAPQAETDWPDPGRPRLTAAQRGAPRLLWRTEVEQPKRLAAGEGRLLVGTATGVVAFEPATGRRLWRFATGAGVEAKPLVAEGRVVFGTTEGDAVALDARDGRRLWRHDLEAGTTSGAVAAGGVVYLGDDKGRLHALELASGRELWRAGTGHFVNGSALVLPDRVLIGSCDEHVWAFDRFDGGLLWKSHAGECVVSDGVRYGRLAIYGSYAGDVLALDVGTGGRVWTFTTAGRHIWYRPLLAGDALFVASGDYRVYALRAATGEELWRFQTGNRALTEIARHEGTILFGSHDRRLYAVDRESGAERWRLETTRPVSFLEVVGDSLYFVADDRYLLAYELPAEERP